METRSLEFDTKKHNEINDNHQKEVKYNNTNSLNSLAKNKLDLIAKFLSNALDKENKNTIDENTRLPKENGEWVGEAGNSKWKPNPDYIHPSELINPERKTWLEVSKKHLIDGIPFKNGIPDFSEVSKGTVKIKDFTSNRYKNFTQADIEFANMRGVKPEDVRQFRKDNGYTWHEKNDMKSMDLLPNDVHGWIPHSGGISAIKNLERKEQSENV
ncbi:MAG: HNH endonuclease [Streptococcus sp.]|nr:HNH endonuclease [Streptococcus sp.]